MQPGLRGILQLDFDGTVAEGDVSTGILARFAGAAWPERVEAASRRLAAEPDAPDLIDAMVAGYAHLTGRTEEHLRYAHEHHPVRPGLPQLIDATERLGVACHVVSNGFQFYIRDYLQRAGVVDRVAVHCGEVGEGGGLVYLDPAGAPVRGAYKRLWAQHFLASHPTLIYAGDGTSDIDAARLAPIVIARDSLLTGLRPTFKGALLPFDTLHDVAHALEHALGVAESGK